MPTTIARGDAPTRLERTDRIVLLHLIPGFFALFGYAVMAAVMSGAGLPSLIALTLTSLLIEAPVMWWLMLRETRSQGRPDLGTLFPWLDPLPWKTYVGWGIPALVFSLLILGAVGPAIGSAILEAGFAWVPDWFVIGTDPETLFGAPRSVLLVMWGLSALMVLIAGPTQELYFRGFLLPRMSHLGWRAPLFNAALFAIFHMIAPWSWVVFFVGTLPWALLVFWKRSVRIGLFAHVGMLALQWAFLTLVAFGFVQPS